MLRSDAARGSNRAHLGAVRQPAHEWQLFLVGGHQQLNGPLPDLEGRHVRQEVIAHKEAHEDCSQQARLRVQLQC